VLFVTDNIEELTAIDINSVAGKKHFKNEIGNKYNMLTVISCAGQRRGGSTYYWNCKCDCGRYIEVTGHSMRKNEKFSCGCVRAPSNYKGSRKTKSKKYIDIAGQKFGELTAIEFSGIKNNSNGFLWLCQCSCGKQVIKAAGQLRSGRINSCGHLRDEARAKTKNNKGPGESTWITKYNQSIHNSGRRDIIHKLTFEEYKNICSQQCYYCDATGSQKRISNSGNQNHQTIFANGIDRINSDLGYVVGNVVPCCKFCNIAKNDLSQEEFYQHIKRLYDYSVQTGRIKP